jgi:Rrf2 family protein
MPKPKGDWVMLLTRKAWYGLIAVKHLAEQPRQNSFSAKDLANSYGFPQEALAKILQGLARAGLLLSHHGIKGGYTLVRDPDQISVLDVIKASEEAPGDAIHGKHWRHLESLPGYHQLHMVSQIVEDALRRVTIADIKEQACSPPDSYDARRG